MRAGTVHLLGPDLRIADEGTTQQQWSKAVTLAQVSDSDGAMRPADHGEAADGRLGPRHDDDPRRGHGVAVRILRPIQHQPVVTVIERHGRVVQSALVDRIALIAVWQRGRRCRVRRPPGRCPPGPQTPTNQS